MQKATSFNDVAIVNVKGSSCRIHFWYIRKDDAISIMKKSKLVDKKGVFYFFINVLNMIGCNFIEGNSIDTPY